jgi:hypothetical protein
MEMVGAVVILFVLGITSLIGIFGFGGFVAPVARIVLLTVPAIFAVSLVIGFALRRRTWFL